MKNMIVMILETSWKKYYRKVTNAWNGKLLVASSCEASAHAMRYVDSRIIVAGRGYMETVYCGVFMLKKVVNNELRSINEY